MTIPPNILAAGDGSIVVIIIALIIAAISRFVKKKQREKEEREAQQRSEQWEQEREQAAHEARAGHPPAHAAPQGHTAAASQAAIRRPTAQPPPVPAGHAQPAHRQEKPAAQEFVQAFREALGLEPVETAPPPRPAPPPAPRPARPVTAKKSYAIPPRTEDASPHMPHAAALRMAAQAATIHKDGLKLPDLHNRQNLRMGIILREVLGPPKALRQTEEMWDV